MYFSFFTNTLLHQLGEGVRQGTTNERDGGSRTITGLNGLGSDVNMKPANHITPRAAIQPSSAKTSSPPLIPYKNKTKDSKKLTQSEQASPDTIHKDYSKLN